MPPLSQLTDLELVTNYQKNQSPKYFGELYNRFYPKIYQFSMGKVQNSADAYDITSDTFLKASIKIMNLKNPAYFSAWIYKIASNICMDLFRSRHRKSIVSLDLVLELDFKIEDNDEDSDHFKEQQIRLMEQVIGTLDAKTKNLMTQKYLQKRTIDDLADETGLSTSAIKMRLSRGRHKVASLMLEQQQQLQEYAF